MTNRETDIIQIVEGCIREKPKAQRALVDQFAPSLMSVARRYARHISDADDILQESFILIFKKISTYDSNRGSIQGWMRRVVINVAIGYYRKSQYHFEAPVENLPEMGGFQPDILSKIGFDELIQLIAQLPDGAREVFNLAVLDQYSHDEISEMLQIPTGTSRSLLSRARKQLQTAVLKIQSDELARI